MAKIDTFLKYGIDSSLAAKISSKKLSLSSLRSLSKKNLEDDYGFEDFEIAQIKDCVNRKSIDEDVLIELLENSTYTCNICRGKKSDAYIVHHIEHYNISQDNSYHNLIVLCPNDHELAHREGEALANKITQKQLISAKTKWEKIISEIPAQRAAIEGDLHDLDYVNVNRILELCIQVFDGNIPETKYTNKLYAANLILPTGQINPELYIQHSLNKNTPLKFFAAYGSGILTAHYFELLLKVFSKVTLEDLDSLLTAENLKQGIVGKYCYYVGGVYGREYKGEITEKSEPTLLHFRRRKIRVKWYIDPMFITSSTASWRIARRTIFLIYGKILMINEVMDNESKILEITIRPYAYGIPNHHKDRTPLIKYIKNAESYDEYFGSENKEDDNEF